METVGDRVKEAANIVGGLNSLAKAIDMPRRTLGDQISGKFEVKLTLIVEVARVTGYSIRWLATGDGPRLSDGTKLPSIQVDAILMERLHDRVTAVFTELGQKPPPRRITREATNLYNDLAKELPNIADAEMVDATLPKVTLELKRRLSVELKDLGQGKRLG